MTFKASRKRSRSEIENALSGRTQKTHSPQTSRPKPVDFQLDASPRRQQVIGGDLTGVSKHPKYGIFSRYAEISVANWIAGFIVILIMVAFFWPRSNDSIREIPDQTTTPTIPSIYNESRVTDVKQSAAPNQTFSRDTDLDRANSFRQANTKELEIKELLSVAKKLLAQGAYTQPENANAAATYKNILTLDSSNVQATQGLNYINNRFLTSGSNALKQNNLTLATGALGKLASINKNSEQYQSLGNAITLWKMETKIAELLKKAKQAKGKGHLILPARKNALYFFQQAKLLDENNKAAKIGIQKIADTYIKRANNALMKGQYEAATGYLATVSVIDSKHPSIPLIEKMIAIAKPIARQANTLSRQQPINTDMTSSDIAPPSTTPPGTTPPSTAPSDTPKGATKNSHSQPLTQISNSQTPKKQTNEQEAIDKQYLDRGLEAYYKGDYEIAAALLQPLADKGVSRAQFRIGYMYYLGRGFKRDRQEADRVIRAALPAIQKFAEEGRTWAQSDLGSLYEDGLILPRDYSEAVYWYRSAAEKDYPGAQTNLGIMYARGRGVTTSRKTAIEWFQRAAKQGDIVAKRNLKAMGVNE